MHETGRKGGDDTMILACAGGSKCGVVVQLSS